MLGRRVRALSKAKRGPESDESDISQDKHANEEEKVLFDAGRRDTWWRDLLRATPIPGFYAHRDFLQDAQLNPVKPTYNFKGEGRKRMSIFQQMPDPTLPDAFTFNPPSFVELAEKKLATYSFKNTSRQSPTSLNYRDKNIATDPGQYDLFPSPVPTFPIKSSMFRSAVQRFPTFDPTSSPSQGRGMPDCCHVFDVTNTATKYMDRKSKPADFIDASVLPVNNTQDSEAEAMKKYRDLVINIKQVYQLESKEGPGPGEYDIKENPPVPLRSCFLSKVPRQMSAYTKVPGPGSYWPTKQSPKQPRTIASLGREHTIFFSNIREI